LAAGKEYRFAPIDRQGVALMTPKLARSFVVAALSGLSGLAAAGTTAIDLSTVSGVPGTGGDATVYGPCYCDQASWFSPVMLLGPGTYDFGTVRQYWVLSGITPDGGPDQGNLWLLFAPVVTSGTWPQDFPPQTTSMIPQLVVCQDGDLACDDSFDGLSVEDRLVFTLPAGQNAVQIGLIGHYDYIPPVPEPVAPAMLLAGLALVAGLARRPGVVSGLEGCGVRS
jgi:hypothetical protein